VCDDDGPRPILKRSKTLINAELALEASWKVPWRNAVGNRFEALSVV
jgi:hypothetical protein